MKCAFCFLAKPFKTANAEFVIDGISVCEDHIDAVSGQGFGKDLHTLHMQDR